jgi:hypothetical protein
LRHGMRRDANAQERSVSRQVSAALHNKLLPLHFLRR